MDVVNFDALKAQGRILNVSDVDPNEDYFIIGKRNVHYNTNSFKATEYPIFAIKAGDVMGGGTSTAISIPRPEISLGATLQATTAQSLIAHYLPTGDTSFLNHNPKYYLFMQKSKTIKKKNNNKVVRPSGIYHPTHLNGVNFPANSKYYGGTTTIPLHTEFNVASTPYTKTVVGVEPFEWTRYRDPLLGYAWRLPVVSDFDSSKQLQNFKIQGKKYNGGRTRSALMYLCIGIENQDTTSEYPILFGQLSMPFKIALKALAANPPSEPEARCTGVQFLLENSSVHRKMLPL